jgi:molybdate-binding protein
MTEYLALKFWDESRDFVIRERFLRREAVDLVVKALASFDVEFALRHRYDGLRV